MKNCLPYKKTIVVGTFATFLASSLLIGTRPIQAQDQAAPLLIQAPVIEGSPEPTATPEPQVEKTVPKDELMLTAIPPRLGDDGSIKIKPGEKKQVEIRVINPTQQPISIETIARDFIVGEDGSTPVTVDDQENVSNRWSLSKWLVMTPTRQVIQPGKPAIINVLIEVPADALPGGHYAMITHKPTIGKLGEKGFTTGVDQEVGTLLYVQVEGLVNEEAYISDFAFTKMSEFGPVPYSFTVENRSDIHIAPQIGITITNWFGKQVDIIQPETKNIFPFTSRKFSGEWKRVWGIGPYTAKLTMSFGNEGKVVIVYSKFWIFPVKLVISAIVVLLTLIAMGISIRRHILHKKNDQSKKIEELEKKLENLQKTSLEKYEE